MQFDRDTLRPIKNNTYVKFEETLRMDRFLDSAEVEKKSRSRAILRKLRKCQSRIASLSPSSVSRPLFRESDYDWLDC